MRKPEENNDHELSLLIASGNTGAFREFYNIYRNKVFSIALKFTNAEAEAEDLVQEIFTRIWLNKEKLAEVENLNKYLNAVVRNYIFNHLRKTASEQKMMTRLSAVKVENSRDSSDLVCYRELQRLIYEAVGKLPPQQQKVYQFSRHYGLKHEEIAARMGISRSTVKGHMVEALNSIRKYLNAKGEMIGILTILFLLET